jgi:hypothetical protein
MPKRMHNGEAISVSLTDAMTNFKKEVFGITYPYKIRWLTYFYL